MKERAPAPDPPVRPAYAPIWELLGFDSLRHSLAVWRFELSASHGATPKGYREDTD